MSDERDSKPWKTHTLADHQHAAYHPHEHGPDADHTHDHDHLDYQGPIEDHPLWQRDNVILWSVGIDIGSSGTQVLFSRVHLQRQGVDLSSRYIVVSSETCYESPVRLTPYKSETLIDDRAVGEIVDDAYQAANVSPEDVDTGVVILTGEALRRENAERIARILSEKCGELVCATAGHHMEAMLAAYGSGAARASYDRNERVLNVDIGGGTTKLSVLEKGKVIATAAIHIGGRLLAVDADGTLVRLDPAGRAHVERAGYAWSIGEVLGEAQRAAVAESMADDLVAALTQLPPPDDVAALYLTDPIGSLEGIDSVVFSGGVAEYIYQREHRDFGDLGKQLGAALRRRVDAGALPWTLLPDSNGIRSTALGASEFTVQLSGNTGYISDHKALLPRRNIQVLRPEFDFTAEFDSDQLAAAIQRHVVAFDLEGSEADLVLALNWQGSPEYGRVRALAEGIQGGIAERIARGKAIYVILDADIAMNLGAVLREDLDVGNDIMVIDGVALRDFDYVDLGKIRLPSYTVPVTIKSLVFNEVSKGPRPRERIHHKPQARAG